MGLFSSSEFDELGNLIDKATSEYIPAAQEDLALNLEITDIIKSKRVPPKDCLRLLKGRLTHPNPNVQLLTLQLLDKCVKNAGKVFLVEMAGREFVDTAVEMMDNDDEYGIDCNQIVQDKLIELFQEWALLFQSDPSLAYLYDVYTNLKTTRRVIFPVPAKSLDQVDPLSIVSSLSPPEWNDSPTCQRCRDTFTMTNRKHHCRKCGGTFCHLCSSNETVLLDMGISDPVRVCDTCYRTPQSTAVFKRQAQIFKKDSITTDKEEDFELKKAIELSLEDQEDKTKVEKNEDEDALKRAIEASLKEVGPTHLSPQSQQIQSKKPEIITDQQLTTLEEENIQMFHQLIGRLVRTRPKLDPEDARDLRKLAEEMRRLQKKDEKVFGGIFRVQLDESLRGYDLITNDFNGNEPRPISDTNTTTTTANYNTSTNYNNTATNTTNNTNSHNRVNSPPTSSAASKDLNQLRNEMLNDNDKSTTPPDFGLVRTRLGSMSLESQNQKYTPEYNSESIGGPCSVAPSVESRTLHQVPISKYEPHMQQQQPTQLPILGNFRHSIHSAYPHSNSNSYNPISRLTPYQSTPIQMCPDLTIHPHPIHPPVSHENPYAKSSVSIEKEKKEKRKKRKDKKKKKEKISKSEKKNEKVAEKSEKEAEISEKKKKKRKRKHKSDENETKKESESDPKDKSKKEKSKSKSRSRRKDDNKKIKRSETREEDSKRHEQQEEEVNTDDKEIKKNEVTNLIDL